MKRFLVAFVLVSFMSIFANAQTSGFNTSISRCKAFMQANPDLVCLPLEVARAADLKLATLQHDLDVARLRSNRLGLTAGCGMGLAATVDKDWKALYSPAATCGVMWGWRF